MVFWKTAQPVRVSPSAASAGMDHGEELLADADEEPDERRQSSVLPPLRTTGSYLKTRLQQQRFQRRESLLTRQLHSETEHSDDEHHPHPPRTLSTQSTWSNQSTASTAELTSDDGRSMPSPTISPPLPPTEAYNALPIHEKPLDKKVQIVGHEDVTPAHKDAPSEKTVEATLGRKRCIMFACRGKDEAKPKPASPPPAPVQEKPAASSPPKRKCTIKFACPMKAAAESKPVEAIAAKRTVSPPPQPRSPSSLKVDSVKAHRGSDSTVTHASPKLSRKGSSQGTSTSTPPTSSTPRPTSTRKLSSDSDGATTEATRFHEFASSEDEPEEWTKESSCHRSRLTVNDTLQKESIIRKACEEVEEEALEEEDEEEAEEAEGLEDEQEEVDEDGDEVDVEDEDEESDHSDAGFHSDDEDGFAASDSEGEDSDYEWWKPGGSTAATSIEHLDHVNSQLKLDADMLASSVNSMSSGQTSPRSFKRRPQHRRHGHARSHAIPIGARLQAEDEELPDSTDFVCGTLDEDRPLEQAYINRMKKLEAAKHKARPQDIDPTFPTSDPEMDEEDDEDLVEPEDSDGENMVHGEMDDDEDDGPNTLRGRPSPRPRAKSNAHGSPAPPRYHSPPPSKRVAKHHSPPLPAKHITARSPPPRKLFGSSPRCARSPAPGARMTSPPNTRRSSPTAAAVFMNTSRVLAERPQLTHTASLPRGGALLLSRMAQHDNNNKSDDDTAVATDIPKRGAIDIVKGLEKKRQRRREKMWQKMCAKAAAKGEKAYKVKPGKGCERMREVGLQLQGYQGKAEHILSL